VGLAFNGLHSYLKEKIDGTRFFTLTQLHQWTLACESQSKETSKSTRHNMHLINRNDSSSNDESKDMYVVYLIWPATTKLAS
jgi:primase-polymerase (primpol)-like protein